LKTLLTLVEKPGHVCYRYRAAAFAPDLQDAGWNLEAVAIPHGALAFMRLLSRVAKADAVMLRRRLLSWWQVRLLRRSAKRLLFDIDDAVFYRDSNSPRGHESRRRRQRFAATVQRCDAVLAGNDFLVEQARQYAAADKVHRFPTCVDAALYRPQPTARKGGAIHLVWIGSRSTMTSLDEIQPGLAEASRRLPGLKLRVICDAFPKLTGVTVEPVVWSEATEAAEIAGADVGISHLPEHPWSLGKCGLKVLQYMAAGLPVIANRYGVHEAMIAPGPSGILASSPSDWAVAIERLANDLDLRGVMGAAGRRQLESEYATKIWGPRLGEILNARI